MRLVSVAAVLVALSALSAFAATKVTFTNKLIDGKKVWVPDTTDIKVGEDLELTLVNPLAEPHGFAMSEVIGTDVVVNAGETKTVKGKAPKTGEFKFHCQLHPVHVGGTMHAK